MTHWLRATWSRFWAMWKRERLDREFDEELNTHLELLIDECRLSGLSRSEARREAIRRLGRPESLREQHRDLRGMPLLDVLAQDLRYTVRMLWKSRVFTCVATLSLALGIGANTALFSLVDDLLLRSLPVRAPERLVQVQMTITVFGLTKRGDSFPKAVFEYIRARNDFFSEIIGFNHMDRPLVAVDGDDVRVASSFCVHAFRQKKTLTFYGSYEHVLRVAGRDLKIAKKKILVLNDVIPGVLDVYNV